VRTAVDTLRGVAEEAVMVIINRGTTPVDTIAVPGVDGKFSGPITLEPGENKFNAVSIDAAGNTSKPSAPDLVIFFVQGDVVQIPGPFIPGKEFFIGLVSPARQLSVRIFNLDGVETNQLKLTAELVAKIYNGDIKDWGDPAIAAVNEGVKIPAGNINVGGVVSRTVTVNVDVPTFKYVSVAEHTTVVNPTGKVEPDAGRQVTAGDNGPTRSVAVGLVKYTAAPAGPVASAARFGRTPTVGAVVSRIVTVNEPVPTLPAASVA